MGLFNIVQRTFENGHLSDLVSATGIQIPVQGGVRQNLAVSSFFVIIHNIMPGAACINKHYQRHSGPKALSTLTHSKQRLQKVMKSWSNLNLVLWGKGRELRKIKNIDKSLFLGGNLFLIIKSWILVDQESDIFIPKYTEWGGGGHLSLFFFFFYAGFPLILSTQKKLGFRNIPHHFQLDYNDFNEYSFQ